MIGDAAAMAPAASPFSKLRRVTLLDIGEQYLYDESACASTMIYRKSGWAPSRITPSPSSNVRRAREHHCTL